MGLSLSGMASKSKGSGVALVPAQHQAFAILAEKYQLVGVAQVWYAAAR